MPEKRIRIALIDDDRVFAAALAGRLSDQPDLQVVGTSGSSVGALELISHNEVDVVALDLDLAGADGFAIGRQLLERWPGLWLVVTAAAADPIRVAEAARRLVRQTPCSPRTKCLPGMTLCGCARRKGSSPGTTRAFDSADEIEGEVDWE